MGESETILDERDSELPSPLPIILLLFLTFYDIQKYSRSTML